MSIYIPFTYIIGWSKLKKFYYGKKISKNCNPSDLWNTYFTSSKYVKGFRETWGEPDIIKIHKTFPNNPLACTLYEDYYLSRINAKSNPHFLNKSNVGKLSTSGMVTTKDILGDTHYVSVKDSRYLSGDLVPITTGMILVKDENDKRFYISTSDPKYLSGELVHFSKNTVCVKDATGKIFRVSSSDPRYTNGELVGSTKGIKPKKKSCIYCGGTFAVGPFALFHGDNCKYNPNNKNENFKIKVNSIKIKCEHCGKTSTMSNYHKWHGNNCKLSPNKISN